MPARGRKPSSERPPDLQIAASVRAREARFTDRPTVRVRFTGKSLAEASSIGERERLPDEVEPGVTYRRIRAGWHAAAWVKDADQVSDAVEGHAGRDHED